MKTTRKTKQERRVVFRFSLSMERHWEIIKLLNSIPKPFRGEFIVESIKMARAHLNLVDRGSEAPPEPLKFNDTFTL